MENCPQPTRHIGFSSKIEGNDEEIEGTLMLLKDVMNSVREDTEMDCLEVAISSLRDASKNETNAKENIIAYHHFNKALLLRYGLYDWIEDLDACQCLYALAHATESKEVIKLLCPESDEITDKALVAAGLLEVCQNSINIATLNTVICTALQAILSYPRHKSTPQIAELWITLGKAYVMKYFKSSEITDLLQGALAFQQAELLCTQLEETSLLYISLTSLSHTHLLRCMACGEAEDLDRAWDYWKKAAIIDDDAENLSEMGIQMSRDSDLVDDTQLQTGIALLTASLHCRREPHPRRWHSLKSLADASCIRFKHKGASEDLDRSIDLRREALALTVPPRQSFFVSMIDLASSLSYRFNHTMSFKDLEECIELHRKALDLLPPSHPQRPNSLGGLAVALSDRFDYKGASEDLEESIKHHRDALDTAPLAHHQRSVMLNNLAVALCTRFNGKETFEDLEECIELQRIALSLEPHSHPNRSCSLNNLANSLRIRFDHKGAFQDLEESLDLCRKALILRPPPHPGRPISLDNLASALRSRFEHKGLFQDLDECISIYQEALDIAPLPDSIILNALANALYTRFDFKGRFKDLEECINLHRKALDLRRAPHPARSGSLNNLASALSLRFDYFGKSKDLNECIDIHREVLVERPQPHPARSTTLNNLSRALCARFKRNKRFEDLEEGMSLQLEALDLQPPPHPDRHKTLNNLADALSVRFEHQGTLKDIQYALECFKEATKYSTGSLIERLTISQNWVLCTQRHCACSTSTLDAYDHSMELLPQLASLDLTLQQRQDALQHTRQLVGNAAKCAINANKSEVAVTYLSTGRSLFWSQALQLRTPVDELKVTHPIIAERLVSISRQLEKASYSERIPASGTSSHGESYQGTQTSLHTLVDVRQQVLEEIRGIPGHEIFLLPPSFSSLQSAANDRLIILLTGSPLGRDALVMHGTNPVLSIPLPDNNFFTLERLGVMLHNWLNVGTRFIELPQDTVHALQRALGRDMVHKSSGDSSEDIFRMVLEYLWIRVVKPVIEPLGIEKTDPPRRIWWCPTGPFASLPIHAAGIYSDNNEPVDCLFQYAISSYCTSLQDLWHSPPKITESFKMTAVIEPEAPNAAVLPATVEELNIIERYIPDQQCLVTYVGSKDSPNRIEDLVSDIQESSFVHFGCHGMQNLKDPLESYLLLSGGKLTMSKIIRECRVPEGALAYLSACETAKGDEERPDESLNLVATMMFAGFRSVVGTMWSILDEDAPIVADVFYGHLFRNGKETPPDVRDAAYGLHLATKELRDRGKSFYSWVPYVHYGI